MSVNSLKWSILILTQPSRAQFLARLTSVLAPQVEPYQDLIEICVREGDASMSVGEHRQIMRESATGEYSNFIDDDDLISDNYVETILPLMDGVDYIGYNLQRYDDGRPTGVFQHTLANLGAADGTAISHINPIKTELAKLVPMSGGFGEDRRWWAQLEATGRVTTEHYIPEVMYSYLYRSNKTDGPPKDHFSF
jgi:hypothetical protein